MKHGPIALIEPPVSPVAIAVHGDVYDKMIGNIMEIKARSGRCRVADDGDEQIPVTGLDATADPSDVASSANDMVWVRPVAELVSPITTAIPLQLLAYHMQTCAARTLTSRETSPRL